jgi:crotonobetainyl-CoA:carnitine CoA-transferase CaiB-like acyl-CoA transferase
MADGIAAPVATMLLAAAGADVIKVEPPGGAATRGTPGFATWNRTKRSVVLDLDSDEGRARLDALLAGADAFVHDLRPSDAARLGLDDPSLTARHPSLVVCGVTAYPIGHPDDDLQPSDTLVLARSGLFDEQMPVGRTGPTFLRMPLGSWGAVYLAAIGVLARLLARARTGAGGAAHTSLLQGALVTMTMHWARATTPTPAFAVGMPKDPAVYPPITPSMFECADGVWIHIMSNPDVSPLMQQCFAEMGPAAVAAANEAHPVGNPNFPNFGANEVAFKRHDSARWLEDLWASDVAVQPAVPMGVIFDDEQCQANGYVVTVEDPQFGTVRQGGIPFTTTPPSTIVRPAPVLGAHTDEVGAEAHPPRPAAVTASTSTRWPLEGLKVLDLGAYLAGPIAPMMLADLGAEVIKLEVPTGDFMRFVERTFAGCQRGKRDIGIDFKHPASRPVLEALVAQADVVHHNLRMPAVRKLRLDYETLRAINPGLVYCHVSSYGPVGPRADWPGYDQLFQAASGWEYEGAGEGNRPMWHRFGMMDHQGGMASLLATLLGLYWRQRTGEGQFVAASLLGASVLTVSETMKLADGTLAEYVRLDADQMGVGPGRRMVEVTDGWIAIDAVTDARLDALCTVAAVSDVRKVPEAFAPRSSADVLAALAAAGVPSTEVRLEQMDAFFDDPATWEVGLAARYPHVTLGTVEQIGGLWRFGDLDMRLDRASPEVGQHTREILAELGYDDDAVAALLAAGAVTDHRV